MILSGMQYTYVYIYIKSNEKSILEKVLGTTITEKEYNPEKYQIMNARSPLLKVSCVCTVRQKREKNAESIVSIPSFTNGLGDRGSFPGGVIPKTQKMVLNTALINTKHYKVCIKVKVDQSRERSSTPLTSRCSRYWKGRLWVALD